MTTFLSTQYPTDASPDEPYQCQAPRVTGDGPRRRRATVQAIRLERVYGVFVRRATGTAPASRAARPYPHLATIFRTVRRFRNVIGAPKALSKAFVLSTESL